jgi:hypothetical protein
MTANVGWVERVVRILVGLPMAVSFLYVRHYYPGWSFVLLGGGIALLMHYCLGTSTVKRPALTNPEPVE